MISITDPASSQLRTMMQQQGLTDLGLRVFVSPGGCSGFQYGMKFEDSAMDGDEIATQDGIQLYVDEFSAQYLEGSRDRLRRRVDGRWLYSPQPKCGHEL